MFIVAYGHDGWDFRNKIHTVHCHETFKRAKTLEEAAALREVAGDLVFFECSGNIVASTKWMFDWEKQDENCYARKSILRKAKLIGMDEWKVDAKLWHRIHSDMQQRRQKAHRLWQSLKAKRFVVALQHAWE